MNEDLVAPCGINCRTCVAYFGYRMDGGERKHPCSGCRLVDKKCAFLKNKCEKLANNEVEYCYECEDFPCKDLEKLDERYREKYSMSIIENLELVEENGIETFLEEQEEKYKCPECGGTFCVHTDTCYECENLKKLEK